MTETRCFFPSLSGTSLIHLIQLSIFLQTTLFFMAGECSRACTHFHYPFLRGHTPRSVLQLDRFYPVLLYRDDQACFWAHVTCLPSMNLRVPDMLCSDSICVLRTLLRAQQGLGPYGLWLTHCPIQAYPPYRQGGVGQLTSVSSDTALTGQF